MIGWFNAHAFLYGHYPFERSRVGKGSALLSGNNLGQLITDATRKAFEQGMKDSLDNSPDQVQSESR